ncbi:zinc finger protein 33B-like [Bolinopsis microptera]|uniref:zinc finger protein 33B-like n=1 Tax=Bolinopsis microptera TaxID=2820187 RepID=UPI003078B0A8
MAEQKPKELRKDNHKIEMIKIEQPATSLSSCACKLEDGCPEFSNVLFKTEPTINEDMKEMGYMNSCRSVIKTEPVDCKEFQCDLCQESVDQPNSSLSNVQSVPDPLKTNPHSNVVISHPIENTNLSGSGLNLKKRMSTHTGEKSDTDSLREYRANKSSQLNKDMLTHTGEKLYKCDICTYSARQNAHLTAHKRTHTGEKPYPCSLCDYRAKTSGVLKRHMFTHTGEKPHKCDICNYSAVCKSSLLIHKRTHTGEKPQKCDICNYSAATKSTLMSHKRTHTEMAEKEPEELNRDNPKTEMKEIEQPAASSSFCACKLEDGCPEFSNEPFKTEPSTDEDIKEVEMAEQKPKELRKDNHKTEMIKIEQAAASSSSCASFVTTGLKHQTF